MTQTIRTVGNWIANKEVPAGNGQWLDKITPHDGQLYARFAASDGDDVRQAVAAASSAFPAWTGTPPVRRGQKLSEVVDVLKRRAEEMAACVAIETGKPIGDARGEVGGAILQGEYFAGEGMRLYARSLTSGTPGKYSHSVRQPRGIAGLVVPANTPIANLAWKIFPALVCGNTAVVKSSEDAPYTANLLAEIFAEAGLEPGILNVIHGAGNIAGAALVEHEDVSIVSFTGSTATGRWIAERCARRLARVSLELGGKNPFVVCDDADIDQAVHFAALSAFSNAGQRCAAGSRLIVFDSVYEEFVQKLAQKAVALKLGVEAGCDVGPLITKRQLEKVLDLLQQAQAAGGKIVCGGQRATAGTLSEGWYLEPTLLEGLPADHEVAQTEMFAPAATLHRVSDIHQALEVANGTVYGLTAAIHTKSVDRAMWFAQRVRAGVANVNMQTFGSEPHMPFGGFGASGNGTREPGAEALDVYSELKNITFLTRENLV